MAQRICVPHDRGTSNPAPPFRETSMHRLRHVIHSALITGLVAFAASTSAQRDTSTNTAALTARLSGASEVPPTPSNAKGDLQATLDKSTRILTWTLTVSGLSGPPTAAHFHGPAAAGENAGVAAPITVTGQATDNGVITLTSAQMDDLLAGRWYVNVHTTANPNGEIRGQMMVGPPMH
jgi:CHRD domain-containing protein